MFIASLNHTKFNSCHLLLQQSFILSSIVTTIDDKNYFNDNGDWFLLRSQWCKRLGGFTSPKLHLFLLRISRTGSCKQLLALREFCWFCHFSSLRITRMDICKPCLVYFGCRKHFSHEITFALQFCSRKGLATLWWCVSVYFHLADNPSEASFKPLQYVTSGAMGLSWH